MSMQDPNGYNALDAYRSRKKLNDRIVLYFLAFGVIGLAVSLILVAVA